MSRSVSHCTTLSEETRVDSKIMDDDVQSHFGQVIAGVCTQSRW